MDKRGKIKSNGRAIVDLFKRKHPSGRPHQGGNRPLDSCLPSLFAKSACNFRYLDAKEAKYRQMNLKFTLASDKRR